MAYYQNAPKKRTKTNYAETGSWDEEGSHYSGRKSGGSREGYGSGRTDRFGSRKDSDSNRGQRGGSGRNDRTEYHTGKSGGSGDRRSFSASRTGEYQNRTDRGNGRNNDPRRFSRAREDFSPRGFGKPQSAMPAPSRRKPADMPPSQEDYRDFEYRRPSEIDRADKTEQNDRILCGRNPIREALRSGREIEKLLVQKGELSGSAREIVMEAREKKIMVQEVDKRRMDEIALHHQGLIAFASEYAYAEVEDILLEAEKRGEAPFIILLDGVTDPHNLGAIIRTAECVGTHGVIIPLHRSVGLTPAAVKASAGAIEHMKVARVTNLNRTIDDLKKQGIWTYAMTMDGKDYEKVDFHGGTALVIGAEGEGISRLTAEKCDLSVSLPMRGEIDSLNASVAAGIIMYRVLSSRKKG